MNSVYYMNKYKNLEKPKNDKNQSEMKFPQLLVT